jgi:integrase/recombinase XerC
VDERSPADGRPAWFASFLADRGTRKPSPHTLKAYGQDFEAIAAAVMGDSQAVARMPLHDITTESMRVAFAQYAETHSAASILRCWSTWNVLCTYLFTSELIAAIPWRKWGAPEFPKPCQKVCRPTS